MEFGKQPQGTTSSRSTVSREHRDVLSSVDRIGNGAHLNDTPENLFPKNPPGFGIESSEPSIQIPPKNQLSGGGQYSAIPGNTPGVNPSDLTP